MATDGRRRWCRSRSSSSVSVVSEKLLDTLVAGETSEAAAGADAVALSKLPVRRRAFGADRGIAGCCSGVRPKKGGGGRPSDALLRRLRLALEAGKLPVLTSVGDSGGDAAVTPEPPKGGDISGGRVGL